VRAQNGALFFYVFLEGHAADGEVSLHAGVFNFDADLRLVPVALVFVRVLLEIQVSILFLEFGEIQ